MAPFFSDPCATSNLIVITEKKLLPFPLCFHKSIYYLSYTQHPHNKKNKKINFEERLGAAPAGVSGGGMSYAYIHKYRYAYLPQKYPLISTIALKMIVYISLYNKYARIQINGHLLDVIHLYTFLAGNFKF